MRTDWSCGLSSDDTWKSLKIVFGWSLLCVNLRVYQACYKGLFFGTVLRKNASTKDIYIYILIMFYSTLTPNVSNITKLTPCTSSSGLCYLCITTHKFILFYIDPKYLYITKITPWTREQWSLLLIAESS